LLRSRHCSGSWKQYKQVSSSDAVLYGLSGVDLAWECSVGSVDLASMQLSKSSMCTGFLGLLQLVLQLLFVSCYLRLGCVGGGGGGGGPGGRGRLLVYKTA
jgi:hypothetical protein